MPIDPSIALSGRAVQMPDPMESYAKLMQIQHGQQQMGIEKQAAETMNQDRLAQVAERQQQVQLRGQAMKSQQVIDQLMSSSMVQDETTGTWSFDRAKFEAALLHGGNGHMLPQVNESLDKMDESTRKASSARRQTIADALVAVHKAGNTPGAVQTAAALLQKNNLIDASHVQPLLDAVDQGASPDQIGQMLEHIGQGMPEYQAALERDEKRKSDLSKTQADIEHIKAQTIKALRPDEGSRKLVEVTEPDGSPGFRVFDAASGALSPLSAEGVGPKRPPQTPESMQLTEVTGPDGSPALANYSPRSGQLSPVQAPGFAPKQPTRPTTEPSLRTVNVVVDGQPKVATFNPQSGRLMVDGEDITGRAAPLPQQGQAPPNLQRADVEVDGQPAVANFNPRAGTYTDPSGADISSRVKPRSASGSGGSDYDKFLVVYARERGKTPATMTVKDLTAARQEWARADDKPAIKGKPVRMMRDGEPIWVRPDDIQPGDEPYVKPKTMPAAQAAKLGEYDNSLKELAVLRRTILPNGINSGDKATGTAAAASAALPNFVTDWTGIGSEAKSKQAVIDRVKQVIGKALEGGVLRKEDETKYLKILPTIGDTDRVVETKLSGLDAAIRAKKQSELDAIGDAGYDVSKFAARAGTPAAAPRPKVGDKVGRFEIVGVK